MKILVLLFFAMLSSELYAQSVIVNPDGTHSVVHGHGDSKVMVNPNGTHSILNTQASSQQRDGGFTY
ncbi:hypothetical protein [Algoriphagus sp. Y33]|uniref:hypothetical protein n=1 Tax=Algoriphagus sp. Y33 TaxID=2772483 RepID=UPI00177B428F|nr:hypothetical protein [Algoriphagus sp. Y33]